MPRNESSLLGDARLLPRFRGGELSQVEVSRRGREQSAVVMSALADAPTDAPLSVVVPATAGELRGIPAIARGVSGVSPGTHPEDVLGRVARAQDRDRRASLMVAELELRALGEVAAA